MTDTPTREPFDVKAAMTRIRLGNVTDLIAEFSGALEEIERLRDKTRAEETDKWIDLHAKAVAERDAALARLALAEKVIEAVRLEEECLASDDPAKYHAHNGLYKLVQDALVAYDAATREEKEGARKL